MLMDHLGGAERKSSSGSQPAGSALAIVLGRLRSELLGARVVEQDGSREQVRFPPLR